MMAASPSPTEQTCECCEFVSFDVTESHCPECGEPFPERSYRPAPPPPVPPPRLKTCSQCGEAKREREFACKGQRRANGSTVLDSRCKACRAVYDRETRDDERRARLREYRKRYEQKVKSAYFWKRANS